MDPNKPDKNNDKNVTIGAIIFEPGNSVKNKTGSWRTEKPVIDYDKCKKCMRCWMFCPDNAISKDIVINYDYCKGCGVCANVCPFNAIEMKKEEK